MHKPQNCKVNNPEPAEPIPVACFSSKTDRIDAALNPLRTEAETMSTQVRAEGANAPEAYKTTDDAAVSAGMNMQTGTCYHLALG